MAITWGATTLNVIQDSYAPASADGGINEIRILGDPATPDVPASVIQQGGRVRERTSFDCWVEGQAEYEALLADHYAGTVREFAGHDGVTFDAVILSITPKRRVFEWFIEYSITFMEAEVVSP